MNWFRHHAFALQAGECFTLAVIILFSFVAGITSLRIALWLLTREGNKDESEKQYWREHGG